MATLAPPREGADQEKGRRSSMGTGQRATGRRRMGVCWRPRGETSWSRCRRDTTRAAGSLKSKRGENVKLMNND